MNPAPEEIAALYVLDQLEPAERAAFEKRLAHDAALAALVRELETTLAHSVHALPSATPPDDLLARIEQQLDPAPPRAAVAANALRFPVFARWGLAAIIALSLATLAVQSLRRPTTPPLIVFVGLDAQRSTLTALPATDAPRDPDARFIQLASLAEQFWKNPSRLPLKSTATPEARRGYALFDPSSQQGFIAVEQLPAITARQRYHLWILDTADGTLRDAGTLPLGGAADGLYSFSLPAGGAGKPDRLKFFVTAEDESAPASISPNRPRGQVVLGDERI